ncbi:hypothetical protein AB0N93_28150 [Streptomyces sp. NPDC091267]|uniref:hypothetical protein n=1 Tax=Streptomyces sp. NPDC091267 TaxID=3155195 RepID=UPI00343DB25C
MTGPCYAVEITATTGSRAVPLGGAVLRNRRLALRWLRRQALRLVDGRGASCGSVWSGGAGVRRVVLRSSGVREGLRSWAGDEGQQDEAMARLQAGSPDVFTVVDPVAGLLVTLTGWRVRPDRAVEGQRDGRARQADRRARPYDGRTVGFAAQGQLLTVNQVARDFFHSSWSRSLASVPSP